MYKFVQNLLEKNREISSFCNYTALGVTIIGNIRNRQIFTIEESAVLEVVIYNTLNIFIQFQFQFQSYAIKFRVTSLRGIGSLSSLLQVFLL